MSSEASLLPPGFEVLAPFVEAWAIAGSANRAQRRADSTAAQRQTFYDAAREQLEPALAYLDGRPLQALSACEERLMNLMLSFGHVAMAIEVQGPDEPKHAALRQGLQLTRSSADWISGSGRPARRV